MPKADARNIATVPIPRVGPGGNVGPMVGKPRVVPVPGGAATARKVDADVVNAGQEQQAGVTFSPVNVNGYALTSLQLNVTVSSTLQLTPTSTNENLVYGPQIKIGSSSCMVIRVVYLRDPGDADTTRRLDVYDTCAATEYAVATIDSAFVSRYGYDRGDGYGLSIAMAAVLNQAQTAWQLEVWPNNARAFDTVWTGTTLNPTNANGKALFFIDAFQAGACPNLPSMHVWNFQGYAGFDPSYPGAAFLPLTLLQPQILGSSGNVIAGTPDCFNSASAIDPYYYVYNGSTATDPNTGDFGFAITTATAAPLPTPSPSPTPTPSPSPSPTPLMHKTPIPTPTPAPVYPMVFSQAAFSPFSINTGSQTQTLTVSENGYGGLFKVSGASSYATVTCAPSNCAPSSAGGSVSITLNAVAHGSSTLVISDTHSQSASFPFQAVAITEFGPTASSASALTLGNDGNVWFVEQNAARVGKVTPSGTITELQSSSASGGPTSITNGPDGNLWFTDMGDNTINRISTSGAVTIFSSGISSGADPTGITSGPDGNLWFTEIEGDRIGRITTSGQITEYSAGLTAQSEPNKITRGPDGNLWFTEYNNSAVGRITTAGVITEFVNGITRPYFMNDITAGADGNVWFTSSASVRGLIGRITPTGVVTEFSAGLRSPTVPVGIAAGPDGNLWFCDVYGYIGRVTPSGTISEFMVPYSSAYPTEITVGSDGNLWFTDSNHDAIGRLAF